MLHFIILKMMLGGNYLTLGYKKRPLPANSGSLGGVEQKGALLPQFPHLLKGEKVLCLVGDGGLVSLRWPQILAEGSLRARPGSFATLLLMLVMV